MVSVAEHTGKLGPPQHELSSKSLFLHRQRVQGAHGTSLPTALPEHIHLNASSFSDLREQQGLQVMLI